MSDSPLPPMRRRAAQAARGILHLGLPLMIAQLAQMSMGFVDTVMIGRVGATELAAVAVGTSLWHPMYLFATGVLMALSSCVAHLHGARRYDAIGPLARQAGWLVLLLAPLLLALLTQADGALLRMGVERDIVRHADHYLGGLAWGVLPSLGYLVLRYTCEGMARARPIMLIGFLGLAVNIVANYALIYGHWGLPALGARGCGLATALTHWVMFGALWWHLRRMAPRAGVKLAGPWPRPERAALTELLRLGLPIGTAIFIEASIFAAIALILGGLGATVLASHQIALNVISLSFMIPLSLSMALTVRVGQALGRGDPQQARLTGQIGIALAASYMAGSALVLVGFRHAIPTLYTPDPAVIELAAVLLGYAALFQVFDGLQVSAAGALRGLKDARVPMLITVLAYWVLGLPLGYWLGIHRGLGAPGPWIGLSIGLAAAAVMLVVRFLRLTRSDGTSTGVHSPAGKPSP